MQNRYDLLKRVFGYDTFRPGQEKLIDAILEGRDALGIMPTGGGKSLCYQIPALLLPGITLVISPLISLMKDQVSALKEAGVAAAYLNSSLTPRQMAKALENAKSGMYRIIYVAPERLFTPGIAELVQAQTVSLLAVDEAHCVSQWGQDFRPSYLQIADFLQEMPHRPPVAAFTATATDHVREDICRLLALNNPECVMTGFDRTNLFFEVRRVEEKKKKAEMLRFLREHEQQSGIVYCGTRKTVEEVCETLREAGFASSRYHAGLSDEERRESQEDFLYDRVRVLVATNAFGMGIDKSNVSYVLHYNMPKDLESYYQEAGRAGRDGSPAVCLLLYSPRDVKINEFLIQRSSEENTEMTEEQRENVLRLSAERLKQMTFYAASADCLRARILRYFGEEAPTRCNACANCLHSAAEEDVTAMAQTILTCVREGGERYGLQRLTGILFGEEDACQNRFSAFGLLRPEGRERIRACMEGMIAEGYLAIEKDGPYRCVKAAGRASELDCDISCTLLMPPLPVPEEKDTKAAAAPAAEADAALYEKLVLLRGAVAERRHIPAYVIFSNATLEQMSRFKPCTQAELLKIHGVGESKLASYGAEFLAVIRKHCGVSTISFTPGGPLFIPDSGKKRK